MAVPAERAPEAAVCRVCGGGLLPKWRLTVLERYPADYFECVACGCLQIPDPHWLAEAYRDEGKPIATNVDRGRFCRNFSAYLRLRALEQAGLFGGPLRVLDYGGGFGILAAMLRLAGRDCRQFDPYCPLPLLEPELAYRTTDEIPAGGFNAVVALEVLEHLCDPVDTVRSLAGYLDAAGSLVLSTGLYEPGRQGEDWPYLSRAAGQHVTFYTRRSLRVIADACDVPVVSLFAADDGFLIVLTRLDRPRAEKCLQQAGRLLGQRRLMAAWTADAWDIRHHSVGTRSGRSEFIA